MGASISKRKKKAKTKANPFPLGQHQVQLQAPTIPVGFGNIPPQYVQAIPFPQPGFYPANPPYLAMDFQPGTRRRRKRRRQIPVAAPPPNAQPMGFIPPGFQPQQSLNHSVTPIPNPHPSRTPSDGPVIPHPPMAPSSSSAPPPLFTPGGNEQLRGFPSPIDNAPVIPPPPQEQPRRTQTPFAPFHHEETSSDDSTQDQVQQPQHTQHESIRRAPRVPLLVPAAPHILNPIPAPPRNIFAYSPYKHILNLSLLPTTKMLDTPDKRGDVEVTAQPTASPTPRTAPSRKSNQKEKKGNIFRRLSKRSKQPEQLTTPVAQQPTSSTAGALPEPEIRFYPIFVNAQPSAPPPPPMHDESSPAMPIQSRSHSRSHSHSQHPSAYQRNSRHRLAASMTSYSSPRQNPLGEYVPSPMPLGSSRHHHDYNDDIHTSCSSLSGSQSPHSSPRSQSTYPTSHHPDTYRPGHGPTVPLYFTQDGEFSGFMNHSPHSVAYQGVSYPSAAHLWEAMKFLETRPDLAARVRECGVSIDGTRSILDFTELYRLTTSPEFTRQERTDWSKVFLQVLEEIVYLKFTQHSSLRQKLLATGNSLLLYSDQRDGFWGDGPSGNGDNHLGKVLIVVRERLRQNGFDYEE